MIKVCPACKTVNEDSATQCECGALLGEPAGPRAPETYLPTYPRVALLARVLEVWAWIGLTLGLSTTAWILVAASGETFATQVMAFAAGVAASLFNFLVLLAFAELLRIAVDVSHSTMRTAIALEARRE